MRRRQWILLGLVAVAAVLAFALRDVVERSIIQPVAYFWWVLGLYYTAFPQLALWVTLVVVVAFLGLGTLTLDPLRLRRKRPETRPVQGPVETLAVWMVKAPQGIYFKWLIAQRLGRLARSILAFNRRTASRSPRDALRGSGWDPPDEVAAYLESGLNGSFADFPRARWPFQRTEPTPLDIDPQQAIDYIESHTKS